MAQYIDGTQTSDKITVNEGKGIIKTGTKERTVNFNKKKSIIVRGKDGKDSINFKDIFATGNKIYGDAGNDKIKVKSGSKNKIYGGTGNDTIVIGKYDNL